MPKPDETSGLKVINFVEGGEDIFDGDVGLDAVDGVEDKSATRRENAGILTDLFSDILLGAKRKDMLSVDAANLPTTREPIICQFPKKAHLISAIVSVGYKKGKNYTTVSMAGSYVP